MNPRTTSCSPRGLAPLGLLVLAGCASPFPTGPCISTPGTHIVTTVAGGGDGSAIDGPALAVFFAEPGDVALDGQGNLIVADTLNNRIAEIDAAGNVTTVAGNGPTGVLSEDGVNQKGFADGTGGPDGTASFFFPGGVAVDPAGNIFVADTGNGRVRKINTSGNVTTLAWTGAPVGIAVEPAGTLVVTNENAVLRLDSAGDVTVVAGAEEMGTADGTGGPDGTARFHSPAGLAVDAQGNIFVADTQNERIRRIDTSGNVTTLAGAGAIVGLGGFADGKGGVHGVAAFETPSGVAVDSAGNVYVADAANNRIRRIDPAGNVTTVAGSDAISVDQSTNGAGGCNGPAMFNFPTGVAVDAQGNLFVADSANNLVRKIAP